MNIKETFLNLTSKTYPHGSEEELIDYLPENYFKDSHGNYFVKIGESKTCFTCHLDTSCRDQSEVIHVFEGNYIKTNGKSILGADDKAGMTIILHMIEKKIPGYYCFFIGEEVGCIGSSAAAKEEFYRGFDRMISFDRRGTSSIITFQSSRRCCSDDFANEVKNQFELNGLQMTLDQGGVWTDSAEFVDVIHECTNISVGYYREHSTEEYQDIDYLERLCEVVTKVDWESLPTVWKAGQVEKKPRKRFNSF